MKRSDITEIWPEAGKEAIDRLMSIAGADLNAAKAETETLRGQLQTATAKIAELEKKDADPAELQRALQRAETAENELAGLKLTNQLREIRENVAKEKGVPANLLTGDSEETCKAQADAILAFAKPGGYPPLKDGGESTPPAGGVSNRERFANFAKENL